MKIIKIISEDEMVAEFLKGEARSERFSNELLEACSELGVNNKIILIPNTSDEAENKLRRKVLSKYRGWKENRGLFEDFPQDVRWYRAELSFNDLLALKYVDYSYWNELSNSTRLVRDGVASIKEERVIFDVSNDNFWRVAEAINNGVKMPPLILIQKEGQLEILEGHLRATAYGLVKNPPKSVEVIIGKP